MAQSKSTDGYPDARAFLNMVIESKRGKRIIFNRKGDATTFRFRCYSCRTAEMKRNCKIYDKDDLNYGQTAWDCILFKINPKDDKWVLTAVHDEAAALDALDAVIEDI